MRTGKKVAVVGSGPAGLACAAQLNRAGHLVTVFERADRIGGLLMYGIPNMKLDKKYVQRRVDLMAAEGVVFVTSCEVGKDLPAREAPRGLRRRRPVRRGHEAERLLREDGGPEPQGHPLRDGVPARQHQEPARQPAPGRQVHLGEGQGRHRHRRRRHRHGLRRHVAAARLPEPPATGDRADAAAGPRRRTTPGRSGRRSTGSTTARKRRRPSSATTRASIRSRRRSSSATAAGNLKEIHTVRVEWVKDNGRAVPRNVPGSEKVFPAQLVLLAMGFSGPENQLLDQLGVEKDARTNAKTEYGKVQHERGGRVRGGRHAARAEPGRLGDQRGPRGRERVRQLSDE